MIITSHRIDLNIINWGKIIKLCLNAIQNLRVAKYLNFSGWKGSVNFSKQRYVNFFFKSFLKIDLPVFAIADLQ